MLRNGHVRFGGRVGETDRRQRRHRAPARPCVSGLPSPRACRRAAANRPNSISRVFSGCSSKPNFANLLAKLMQEPLGVVHVLESDDVVVGEPHEDHVPARVSPAPLVGPEVEHVVQIDVGRAAAKPTPLALSPARSSTIPRPR